MNLKQILRGVSVLLIIIAFFMLIPLLIALWRGENSIIQSFIIPAGSMLALSICSLLLIPRPQKDTVSTRDSFVFVSLGWFLTAFFSALPFYLSGAIPTFVDAFFETMSGYTTTGASILTDIEVLPGSILFWRSLTHWLGGMGIVVLTVAILPLLRVGGLQLIKAEAPGPTVDKITPKVTQTAKILWFMYTGMTVGETLLLMAGGLSLFDALTHTFGTLATGGFSPKNSSVGHYSSAYIHWVVTFFMLLAGTNFILHYKIITGDIKSVLKNTEFRVYIGIFAVATLFITFNNLGKVYFSPLESLRYASFQAASILTTTGFVTTDYEIWPGFSRVVLFLLMFVGGCSGSTGGGMKVIRIVTLIKQGWKELKYLIYPKAVFQIKLNGHMIRADIIHAIFGFVFLYLFLIVLTTFVVATGGNDILTSLSTSLVTLGNIGPGFGKIGPSGNYAFYPSYIKWFLSFIMMAGRLEVYTVLVLFTPTFWKR